MLIRTSDFKLFFQEYFEPVYRFCRKYTEDEAIAHDITQEAFIRLYEKRSDFEVWEKAKSFVYTTAKNLCLDYLKHKKIEIQYTRLETEREEHFSFLHEITYQETLRLLHQAIDKLPTQSREIILCGLTGKNNNEIAEKLGISVNTVKTLKKSAYKTLRGILGNHLLAILLL